MSDTRLEVPEEVLKSIVASTPGDLLVLKFVEKQAECVSATISGTLRGDGSALERMGDLMADVWILSSAMMYVFPALSLADLIKKKLEAHCEALEIPEATKH